MPRTAWTPRIVPYGADQTVNVVIDSFPGLGEIKRTDVETIIADLISGQFNDPIRVVAFNTLEHWPEDVTQYITFISPSKFKPATMSKALPSPSIFKTSFPASRAVLTVSSRSGWRSPCGAAMDWPDYLRDQADMYRQLAEQADDPAIKNEMLELASVCEDLASDIEDHLTGG